MHYFLKRKTEKKNKKKRTRTGAAGTGKSGPMFGSIKQRPARGSATSSLSACLYFFKRKFNGSQIVKKK